MISKSTLENIGQLLVVGFEGTAMSPQLRLLLKRIQPAGVILFARNIVAAEQTHRLLRDCRAGVATPLFTCVDMEGGLVDRFRKVLGPSPSAADVYATEDRKLLRKHGKIIGECCCTLGFNTDLAPVVDLAFKKSVKVLGSRAISANPEEAIRYAREFLAGLRSAGVLGCLKHFPGLGEANLDTHRKLAQVSKPWKALWSEDLKPYRDLRREVSMVLVGHAAYSCAIERRTPASLSKQWIGDILRKKIGYRGLVISDDLEMGAVLRAASTAEASVEHIRAGGDLALICHGQENIIGGYEALIREAERDRAFAKRCQESIQKILAFKKNREEVKHHAAVPSRDKIEKLTRKLWEFGEQVRLAAITPNERRARA